MKHRISIDTNSEIQQLLVSLFLMLSSGGGSLNQLVAGEFELLLEIALCLSNVSIVRVVCHRANKLSILTFLQQLIQYS